MSGPKRARVGRGILELLEKVDLPEGTEVSVTIRESPAPRDLDAFGEAAGSWKGSLDADALIERLYADRSRPSRGPMPRL